MRSPATLPRPDRELARLKEPTRHTKPCDGADAALAEPGTVLLIAEDPRGTAQVPRAVAAICESAVHNPHVRSVRLGLELPVAYSRALDAYVHSPGARADLEALLSSEHCGGCWSRGDGVATLALFDLLEVTRKLCAAGANITVFGFADDGPNQHRRMSTAALKHVAVAQRARPPGACILLAGIDYARLLAQRLGGDESNAPPPPMGQLMQHVYPTQVRALVVRHAGGTAWLRRGGADFDEGAREAAAASGAPPLTDAAATPPSATPATSFVEEPPPSTEAAAAPTLAAKAADATDGSAVAEGAEAEMAAPSEAAPDESAQRTDALMRNHRRSIAPTGGVAIDAEVSSGSVALWPRIRKEAYAQYAAVAPSVVRLAQMWDGVLDVGTLSPSPPGEAEMLAATRAGGCPVS